MNFLKLKSIFSFFKKKLNLWTALESTCFLYFGGIDFSNTDTQKMKNKINDPLIVLMVTWIIFLGYVICKIFWDHAIKSEKTSSDLIPLEIFSLLPILYSFFWVKKYIHPNPNRIEIFQFIGVIIFYFLLIKLNYSYYLTLLLLINLILLTSTNILTKRASSILEILGFLFLFLSLIIFFEIDSRPFFENYEAIGLVALNLIGFAIVFFKTESSLEKIKTSLLIILMALQFIFDGIIVYLFYYITILALLFIIILQEKLRIYIFRLFISFSLYIFLITGFLIIMIMAGSGKMGPSPNNKQDFIFITSILNLICFPLIAIFSKRILKKYKFINGEIDKDFILTILQFCGLTSLYIFIARLTLENNDFFAIISLIAINIILITTSNILTKKLSQILEIFSFIVLFIGLTILTWSGDEYFKYPLISYDNYVAIAIIIVNFIGFTMIFLRNKNYLERVKILIIFILMASFFRDKQSIFFNIFYYISNLALIIFYIPHKKLEFLTSFYIFFTLSTIISAISLIFCGFGFDCIQVLVIAFSNILILTIAKLINDFHLQKPKIIEESDSKNINLTFLNYCSLAFFYIFITILALEKNGFFAVTSLIAINIILIVSTNIFTKTSSLKLEILGFATLFANLTIFAWSGDEYFKYPLISYDNFVAIAIIMINFIGFTMIFLRNKNYLERVKILIIFALMISFFSGEQNDIFHIFYYLASLALISYSILNEKLKPRLAFDLFFLLYAIISFFSFGSSSSKQNFLDIAISFGVIIVLGVILISNYFLKKRKLKNDIQNLKINYERKNHEFR